jgi:DNA modification methylase
MKHLRFKSQANLWIRGHDTILFYKKGNNYTFHKQFFSLDERTIKRYDKVDEEGKRYKIYYEKGKEPRIVYLEKSKGRPITDVWTDIISFQTVNRGPEYLGYETQKPQALLERIIEASSNEGDIVLDPFCGCGTAVVAAQKLKRKWIGIDITHLAINLMRTRLKDSFDIDAKVIGEPEDLNGAIALAQQDRYQFQYWACGKIGARPAGEKKKGADSGIDGVIQFIDNPYGNASRVIVQ